jgi:Holliday junction resolvase RusA-like endonuclease
MIAALPTPGVSAPVGTSGLLSGAATDLGAPDNPAGVEQGEGSAPAGTNWTPTKKGETNDDVTELGDAGRHAAAQNASDGADSHDVGPVMFEVEPAAEKGDAGQPRAGVPPLVITVFGQPAPQGSKRHVGHGVMVESSKKVKPWRQDVVAAARSVIESLPQFVNPITRAVSHGIKHAPDFSHGAFGMSDGSTMPIARTCSLLPLDGPLHVRMVFSFTRPRSHYRTGRNAHLLKADAPAQPCGRPDVSKLCRATEDALTTVGVWVDDARVAEYDRLAKVWCGEDVEALATVGCRIEIRALP